MRVEISNPLQFPFKFSGVIMEQVASAAPEVTFDFDFYRFTGNGERPTLVPTPHQAHFMRSRYSVVLNNLDSSTSGTCYYVR